jgi:regulatory protein
VLDDLAGTDHAVDRGASDRAVDAAERLQRALGFALRQLNRRERTVAEIRGHLERREVDPETAEAAIAALLEDGYLDDARYARLFAEDKRELEQWGADRIRRTLAQRGIEHQLIETAVSADGTEDAGSELKRALEILRRRFPVAPRERRDRDRALGMLIRKGYGGELALDALSAYARESGGATLR